MIVGIGVDVVDVERFAAQLDRTPRLRDRLFAPVERGLPLRSLAARFAAKEAVAKALAAPSGMHWHDCVIPRPEHGDAVPVPQLTGTVAARADALGITHWHLSLSHDGPMALAYAIGERRA
ncbi:holo-ACP synthase [Micrococcus cohnii]|mgnify:FL=1|uniref:Holo-[acyl-carrier-protein] synthase n=1 Tax=Micrococcus cohnii TaxID=993416 RepID=A0A7W7M3J1_9MICC|nr:holo-ACP synthase [uncultured Micrococcus sp.]MBB4735690.1 holo-[acyl-carrier protein] synthase [Micrococcus cohnii]